MIITYTMHTLNRFLNFKRKLGRLQHSKIASNALFVSIYVPQERKPAIPAPHSTQTLSTNFKVLDLVGLVSSVCILECQVRR